jgi:hypothetical protein
MLTNLRSAYSARRDLLLLQDEWPSTLFYFQCCRDTLCRQIYVQLTCRVGQVHRLNWIKDMHSGARQRRNRDIIKRMISPCRAHTARKQSIYQLSAGEGVEFWPLASCCFASSSQDAAPSQSVSRRGTHLFAQPAKIIHYD